MLRWLQRKSKQFKLPDRTRYFAQLFLFTASVHALAVLMFAGLYTGTASTTLFLSVSKRTNPARIVLLPMVKQVPGSLATLAQAQPKKEAQPQIQKAQPTLTKKSVVQKKQPEKKPVAKKEPPKKEPPRSTTFAKTEPIKKQPEKKIEKKLEQKVVKKVEPVKPKQLVAQKETVQKKPPVAPKQDKKQLAAQKKEEPIVQDEVVYLGREDMMVMKQYEEVQAIIARSWQPPAGAPADAACTIACTIGQNGVVENAVVNESSNVLIYDIAARMAVSNITFPKIIRGKQLVITFKQ